MSVLLVMVAYGYEKFDDFGISQLTEFFAVFCKSQSKAEAKFSDPIFKREFSPLLFKILFPSGICTDFDIHDTDFEVQFRLAVAC